MKNGIILINITLLLFTLACSNLNSSRGAVNPSMIESIEIASNRCQENNFMEKMELIVDERIFILEDAPKNIMEEIVVRYFLYSITAEFDKKYDTYVNTKDYVNYIESEKRDFEEGIFIKSYIIHKITTLTEDQYNYERTDLGERNPLFYWGWEQRINEFELIDYQIVNVDFSIVHSSWGSQYGDGTFNRSFIVGKKYGENTYRIYAFGVM